MCGNYSREETIQGRKLYEEIQYPEKVEEYIPTFYKIRYILEELYVAVMWITVELGNKESFWLP